MVVPADVRYNAMMIQDVPASHAQAALPSAVISTSCSKSAPRSSIRASPQCRAGGFSRHLGSTSFLSGTSIELHCSTRAQQRGQRVVTAAFTKVLIANRGEIAVARDQSLQRNGLGHRSSLLHCRRRLPPRPGMHLMYTSLGVCSVVTICPTGRAQSQ